MKLLFMHILILLVNLNCFALSGDSTYRLSPKPYTIQDTSYTCFTDNDTRVLVKTIYSKLSQDSVLTNNKRVIDIQEGVIAMQREQIRIGHDMNKDLARQLQLKNIAYANLESINKLHEKEIDRQRNIKVASWVVGGALSGFLSYKLIKNEFNK